MHSSDLDLPKGLKTGNFKWLDRVVYKNAGKLQINLNKNERKLLILQLKYSLSMYEQLVLNLDEVRKTLYVLYNKMILSGTATSQLSKEFNMSMRGHNDKVRDKIDLAFGEAYKKEQLGLKQEASMLLQKVGLNYKILFSPEITKIVEGSSNDASRELVRIKQFREKLFLSVIKLSIGIAHNHSLQLNGNIIEWSDLAQEAIIAAKQAVDSYHPIDSGKTFTSFVYTWVHGILKKKINETLRTTFIPRKVLDKYAYIYKAVDDLGLLLTDIRGGITGEITAKRQNHKFNTLNEGKIDYHTLCKIADQATKLQPYNRKISPEEVRKLILLTQEEISLNLEIGKGEKYNDKIITFGEILPDETLNAEERFDGERVGERLLNIIKKYTSKEEYLLMKLRYGSEVMLGYKKVADKFTKITGNPMNKSKVSSIEKQILRRLKKELVVDPKLTKQLRELMTTLQFIEKK